MSQIRLYVDEDASEHSVVRALRNHGINVITALDAGMSGATDEAHLAFAISQARTIYSLNVGHFCRLHGELLALNQNHCGIALIPKQRYSIGEKVRRLMGLIDAISAEEMRNRLKFL
jgi:hypothetical protein